MQTLGGSTQTFDQVLGPPFQRNTQTLENPPKPSTGFWKLRFREINEVLNVNTNLRSSLGASVSEKYTNTGKSSQGIDWVLEAPFPRNYRSPENQHKPSIKFRGTPFQRNAQTRENPPKPSTGFWELRFREINKIIQIHTNEN